MDVLPTIDDTPMVCYDTYDNYSIAHYPTPVKAVKGGVFDRTTRKWLAVSHALTDTRVLGIREEFVLNENVTLSRNYDGTAVKVWKNNGKVFVSTHKRVNPVSSFWGDSSLSFRQMYADLNGPTDQLFGDCENSDACFIFLMCHRCVNIASFCPLENFLVFIGVIDMKNAPMSMKQPYPLLFAPHVVVNRNISIDYAKEFIKDGYMNSIHRNNLYEDHGVDYEKMPYELLNIMVLCNGYLVDGKKIPDSRLEPGEAVIATYWEGIPYESDIVKIQQIRSFGYDYRFKMRNNDPSIWHWLFTLHDKEMIKLLPWVYPDLPADMTGIYTKRQYVRPFVSSEKATPLDCFFNVFSAAFFIIPPLYRKEITHLAHKYMVCRHSLARVIFEGTNTDRRIQQIISLATKRALFNNEEFSDKHVMSILKNEYPSSLFRLINMLTEDAAQTYIHSC